MFSGTVGAGLLSLPNVFSYYGLVGGIVGILIFGFLTMRIDLILNELVVKSSKRSYANVVAYYMGPVNSLFSNQTAAKVTIQMLVLTQVCNGILYGTVCNSNFSSQVGSFCLL